ncbi:SDR family NAD(P)-dependent oxidoreductase [Microbacterium sp. RD1]|uniref:SDR family NAD(P)-dependent oxidoreductase n=1 Tax=Microbacterium sp. RD1 TaxID=3457313 RepID=UPI003FA5D2B1
MTEVLQDKVIVVTGGAQGIGAAYVRRLVREGASVVVADRNLAGARTTAEAAEGPGEAVAFAFDIASESGCGELADFVGERYGRLDGLINNAAIFSTIEMKPSWEISVAEWDQLMAVNLRGPWLLIKAVLPLLKASGNASIVNVGSDAAQFGRTGYLHYTTGKAGIQGMTFGLSHELGEFGIRVNTLSPGPVYTEVSRATVTEAQKNAMLNLQAIKRTAGPEDMAGLAVYLLSDSSAYVTGQTISVNGGLMHR